MLYSVGNIQDVGVTDNYHTQSRLVKCMKSQSTVEIGIHDEFNLGDRQASYSLFIQFVCAYNAHTNCMKLVYLRD